jgi:CubicO group peptidase (beta-lactamase class C family)
VRLASEIFQVHAGKVFTSAMACLCLSVLSALTVPVSAASDDATQQQAAQGQDVKSVTNGNANVPVTGRETASMTALDALVLNYMKEKCVPGAALAVTHGGRLVYARGFGYADLENKEPVQPNSLFRIASISKAITEATILQLVQRQHLGLNDKVFTLLKFKPFLLEKAEVDSRIYDITVGDVLAHRGGWEIDPQEGDPMFNAVGIATAYGVEPPPTQEQIISYVMGKPLAHEPGTVVAYSNFGYCALGRIIEEVTGQSYEKYVQQNVLEPLGITDMRIGATLLSGRAGLEVKYYTPGGQQGQAVLGPERGSMVPAQYGSFSLESLDANGGWLASAVDIARFASAFEYSEHFNALSGELLRSRFCPGHTWTGGLAGTSTEMVMSRRLPDTCFALLFNSNAADAHPFGEQVHETLTKVSSWPEYDLFDQYLNNPKSVRQ